MPTYVYECSECQDVFEIEQRITEEPLRDCRCGATGTIRRLIQPVGVMFRGSGFHVNDYSGAAKQSAAEPAPAPDACSGDQASCKVCGDA